METQYPELFEYGIHTENSDIRAHVSGAHRAVFAFRTIEGIRAIEKHKPELRSAGQNGVNGVTGLGWLVRPEWINDIRKLPYYSWAFWDQLRDANTTSERGRLAVRCVLDVMRLGRFPLWIDGEEDDRKNIQVSGSDIVLFCRKKIQVKCDYRGGPKPEGTGHLFLQKAERNDRKLY